MIPEASIAQAWGAPPQANEGQYDQSAKQPAAVQKLIAQFGEQQSVTVTASPMLVDLCSFTGGTDITFANQGFSLEIDARDFDVYIRCRADTGSPNTSPSNGRRIMCAAKNAEPKIFWVPGLMYRYMDIVAAAPTLVTWRRVSEPRIRG